MRTLIDGYNLMFGLGLLGKRLGLDGLRKARHRFLNDLANSLGPVDAYRTTVVFDSSHPPDGAPRETTHKGMSILFAVEQDSADERIEQLIAQHSSPKTLTVVSSDQRIRQAASRRKAKILTTDEFWSHLEAKNRQHAEEAPPAAQASPRERSVSAAESEYWLSEFQELADEPSVIEGLASAPGILSDEEIAEIEREVDRERDPGSVRRPGRRRPPDDP